MEMIIRKEGGDRNILISAAILHDVGWSKVPVKLQKSSRKNERKKALKLHIKYAPTIIKKILQKAGYPEKNINTISEIVYAHKFQKPKRRDKRMLIDADTLAESFKKQFYSDIVAYGTLPREAYNFRIKNNFYTKTAQIIFNREMKARKKEIFSK